MASKKSILLLAGLAALAYYKYNKMTAEEKEKLSESFKETGKKILDLLPVQLKSIFDKQSVEEMKESQGGR